MDFRWHDFSKSKEGQSTSILQDHDVLRAVKSCKTLQHLSIYFMETWVQGSDVNYCSVLMGFQRLTSLELYGLCDVEDHLLERIIRILHRCPYLEKLGLSKAPDPFRRRLNFGIPTVLIVNPRDNFLEKLCTRYSLHQERKPLKLKTLRLGWGMFPLPARGTCQNYLAKLVDLTRLRTFHVWNGLVSNSQMPTRGTSLNVQWSMLQDCPSLRQLEITTLDRATRQWLNTSGQLVEELIILKSVGTKSSNMRNINLLKLHKLKTLYVYEETGRSRYAEEDAISSNDADSEFSRRSKVAIRSVLDRLHDHGAHLVKLSLTLEFETQWVRTSELRL